MLRFSLVATLAYVVVTFVAGLRAHSLALLSESGHNVSDFLALLLSFAAVYFQTRPADHARTFGYQRAGVLAAFINAATLIAISLWIAVEAMHRLDSGRGTAAADDDRGRRRRGDERRDRRVAVGRGPRREPALGLPPHGRRHALNRRRHRRRRGHSAHRPELDRPGSLAAHRRAHPLVQHRHRPRNPEHPA